MTRLGIEVEGVVQGVGFRPFVWRLARDRRLSGFVRNRPGGVEIEVQGARPEVESFLRELQASPPAAARLDALRAGPMDEVAGEGDFTILASAEGGPTRPSVPADLALCPDCAAEMDDPAGRRFGYPFTNCTACGPRYSIIAALPYDRSRTSMAGFPMCPACAAEYADPADRRFHAQPIACPACGPQAALVDAPGAILAAGEAALDAAATLLADGRILALKGLGGYQLLADATSEAAVARLRARKRREAKPFAVLFPTLDAVAKACVLADADARVLASPEAPILLLPRRAAEGPGGIAAAVAPGNPDLGAFLPATPLHRRLAERFGRPLVCTSGNLSDEPMAFVDSEARERLGAVADAFLVHDRPVLRPVDDSVGRVEAGTLRLLRRARGFAPRPHPVAVQGPPVLALGGHLKGTVALLRDGQAVVSQHLGDLDSPLGLDLLGRTVEDLFAFFRLAPARLACDLHPGYGSTRLAEDLSRRWGLPLVRVQHHHAHGAACLAELGLTGPALALAWDGSGYGPDGTVWGGEALRLEGPRFARAGHLRAFPLPGGERAVREPRRSALGLCWGLFGDGVAAEGLFAPAELAVLQRMLEGGLQSPLTSSVGRLFDAVAALAGLRADAGFEGQAAMTVEFAARAAPEDGAYTFDLADGVADPAPMVAELLADRRRGAEPGRIARRFHAGLAKLAVAFAEAAGQGDVALTGGCFQNALLADLCTGALEAKGFRVLRPARFPPNDGGLSLGQAWVAAQLPGSGLKEG
ncbi:MAG: carbamoyltransferase HypF [Holophagaceae bacterium]